MVATDEPHERYSEIDPVSNEELTGNNRIPILISGKRGNQLRKEIQYYMIICPECGTTARYDDDSEPICPDCGIVCSGTAKTSKERLIRDPIAAGRVNGDESNL
jgi:rubrerythrin